LTRASRQARASPGFEQRAISSPIRERIAPLVALLTPLKSAADARVARRVTADPVAQRLATTPGVGPVTAVAFRTTLDDVGVDRNFGR